MTCDCDLALGAKSELILHVVTISGDYYINDLWISSFVLKFVQMVWLWSENR